MVWRKIGSTAVLILTAATLAGCAATTERLDHYADRMTTYNKEAELAQDRGILLNVLRASKRRPLSFFELQSVSASGTPSGQVGFSIPLAQNGGNSAATMSPQLNLSNGPTVSANYIDTQEFYQGILKPIPMDTIDFFVQRGIPDNLLFNLFFSKATVRLHVDGKDAGGDKAADASEHVFVNYAGRDSNLDAYQQLVVNLLNSGLTTGVEDSQPSDFGPPLTAAEVADPAMLAKLSDAKLQLVSAKWCDLSADERGDIIRRGKSAPTDADACGAAATAKPAPAGPSDKKGAAPGTVAPARANYALGAYFRVQQGADAASHKLCFSPTLHAPDGRPRDIDKGACEQVHGKRNTASLRAISGCTLAAGMPTEAFPELAGASADGKSCARITYDVVFAPRSTYGVIYYLGEVVRRNLNPDDPSRNAPRVVMVRTASASQPIAGGPCPADADGAGTQAGVSPCRPVFHLERQGAAAQGFLSVDYDGETYVVPDRSGRAGMSNEVLDIVSELIALTRSAKDAPTSSLVTLVGH